ncbi:MAG TPA: tetratricopeptide repeat protein [Bryobacteraceae bacterium]|nr:tetratricopeptide repeat protein [Bryobacteraceae bacterium]
MLFAGLAVLAVSIAIPAPISFFAPLLLLAGVYVPGTVLLAAIIGRLGSVSAVFERDYSPLLTCAAFAWAAVNLPLVVAARMVSPSVLLVLATVAYLYFAVLMFLAVRTVLGVGNGTAAGVVALSWIPLALAALVWGPLSMVMRWLASPFFLLFVFLYLRHRLSGLGEGLRRGQRFRRMLDAAAVNPHDAEAQYQLGLIYQHRRQYSEAIRRFQNAVAIDPRETDAHFQLGRIAREQGRLKDALAHFQTVIDQDPAHNSSEILKELGALYLTVRQYSDARNELEPYLARREYDPEGLYYYGQALEGLGDIAGARDAYSRAVEAARTAPSFRRRYTAKWSRLAQKQLRKAA